MSNKQILFSFRGRIPRSIFIPYWYSILAVNFLLGFPAKKVIGDSLLLAYIFFIFFLFMAWILLALLVKRLHDLNRTGWPFVISALVVFALSNLLVIFHPLSEPILFSIVVGINLLGLALLVFLVLCTFLRGTIGTNKYGPDPLG